MCRAFLGEGESIDNVHTCVTFAAFFRTRMRFGVWAGRVQWLSFPNLARARAEKLRGKETDPRTTSFFLPFPFSFHIKDICHYTPSSLLESFCRLVWTWICATECFYYCQADRYESTGCELEARKSYILSKIQEMVTNSI